MDLIKSIEHEEIKNSIPDISVGDTVRVHQRIKEGNRQRIQVFEGIVIKKQNGGLNETFTVRRISYGVGVEKTFLIHSPLVEKVETIRAGKNNRAKLYYLRDRVGKAAKTKEAIGVNINKADIVLKEEVPGESEVAETSETTEDIVTEPEVKEEVKEEVAEVKEEVKAEEPKAEEAKAEEPAEAEEAKEEPKAE